MKRIIKSNNKLNNKGFTLVEVLIAMSVLVIVSIPMLDTLAGTSVMTRKSSTRQRATLLAQSITEGVKRYSTLDLCTAFVVSPGTKTYTQLENFPVLNRNNYIFEGFDRLEKREENMYKLKQEILDEEENQTIEEQIENLQDNYEAAQRYIEANQETMAPQDLQNLQAKQQHRKEQMDC